MQAISIVVSIVSAVIAALGGVKGVDLSHITPVLQKIQVLLAAVSGLKAPSSINDVQTEIADLEAALAGLTASGLLTGQAATDVVAASAAIAKYKAVTADYESGQAALIDSNFSFNGIKGDLIAIKKGGAAGAALGL